MKCRNVELQGSSMPSMGETESTSQLWFLRLNSWMEPRSRRHSAAMAPLFVSSTGCMVPFWTLSGTGCRETVEDLTERQPTLGATLCAFR